MGNPSMARTAVVELPPVSWCCQRDDHEHCHPAAWGCTCACHRGRCA